METTTKFTITLGARGYNFNVPSKEFLAYLNDDINKLKNPTKNIEIPQFINLYLKKSYSHFQLVQEFEKIQKENLKLKEENVNLKSELQKQNDYLINIINILDNKGKIDEKSI